MYLEVRHVAMQVKCQQFDLDKINKMLEMAQEYDFCDIEVALENSTTLLDLNFKQARTSIFIEQWAKFWMRPFGVEYKLDFTAAVNGREIITSYVPAF